MNVEESPFGELSNGNPARLFVCSNGQGMTVKLTDYGATLVGVEVPDRKGHSAGVLLGFNSLEGYLQRHPYFGSTVGRFCNRIGNARFTLEDTIYTLASNAGAHHLHGGLVGFDAVQWQAEAIRDQDHVGVAFSHCSPHMDEGYPGTLKVEVRYLLHATNGLTITFFATTDRATVLNLTNHGYWNLAGEGKVLDHELTLCSNFTLDVDDDKIPTGQFNDVAGTPFDFRTPDTIGKRMALLHEGSSGFDHCYGLKQSAGELVHAAHVVERKTGRVMDVWTTQPGIQLYIGNYLDGSATTAGYDSYQGFCLETQHYPDAPNHPQFPSTVLLPGQVFQQSTRHNFSCIE